MSYEPERADSMDAAAARTSGPGIFLMVLGILHILAAAGLFFLGVQFLSVGNEARDAVRVKGWDEMNPENRKHLEEQGWTGDKFVDMVLKVYNVIFWGGGSTSLITGIIMFIGGLRMRQLRSRGLAMFASILAMIPFLSPSCCLLVGLAAGIWSLVVLADPRVKEGFAPTAARRRTLESRRDKSWPRLHCCPGLCPCYQADRRPPCLEAAGLQPCWSASTWR